MRTIGRPLYKTIGRVIGKGAHLGSQLNQTKALIMSLSPVFYIEDMTEVSGGYLIDSSGNNKQIAVSTENMENDTITMPANDSDIINALTADGMYAFFYTDDATPKNVKIGQIPTHGTRYLYSQYLSKHFCLFASRPSFEYEQKLYSQLSISKAWLSDVNVFKQLNYNYPANPDALIVPGYANKSVLNPMKYYTVESNSLAFSDTKKTIKSSISGSTVDIVLDSDPYSVGGNYKISYWVNRLELGDRQLKGYSYIRTQNQTIEWPTFYKSDLEVAGTEKISGPDFQGGVMTATVKSVEGDWSRVEFDVTLANNGDHNMPSFGTCVFRIAFGYGTAVAKDVSIVDFMIMQGYLGQIVDTDVLEAPFDKLSSKLVGKKICTIGDSITLGAFWDKLIQHYYGIETIYNTGISGARMMYNANEIAWIPNYKDTVVAQPADIFIILASANDLNSTIGTIDDSTNDTYMGAYQNYLDYLFANIPDVANKKIILCTHPILVGLGNTIEQGRTAYESQFKNMADAVKAIGAKYNLPVCDLHSQCVATYENSPIYLADKVHWTRALETNIADILGKFINNQF